ncbi:MAG: CotH kinase family protein, partial [Polyangiaceae bacterium]|nr:CotH kinase family protein [Polyangiaceae bacterium]
MDSRRLTTAGPVFALTSTLLLSACGSSSASGDGDTASGGAGADVTAGAGAGSDPCELGDPVFDPDTILEYHVTMDPALYETMKANGNDEAYRTAALQVRGGGVSEDYDAVGLRYKGDYSLNHCWDDYGGVRNYSGECEKLSMKIKFNEYDPEARFFGLKRLNFNSMSYDDTKLRERLVYSMFNDFGVGTARTAYAKLYINDEPPLLFLAVEAIDGRYTACKYPEAG